VRYRRLVVRPALPRPHDRTDSAPDKGDTVIRTAPVIAAETAKWQKVVISSAAKLE
jgi:hypothetical protein